MKVVLNEVATSLENVIKVAKVDTDKAPKTSAKYNVHALPTLILFNKGEVVERYGNIVDGVLSVSGHYSEASAYTL